MYQDQIKIIKEFTVKFDSTVYAITKFIRPNRFLDGGVENKKCCTKIHELRLGETAYVFNGEPFGLKSVYCSDLKCFLEKLDSKSVKKYLKSIKKK